MRRGLMQWSADELPLALLRERIGRLRAAMRENALQAFLAYTNLVRPSAVSWLTGFTPYWSEGILLVGGDGEPAFATALSKRVAGWMRSVSPLGEIVNAPRPGAVLGARIAADSAIERVGILELDSFPSGAYDDLVAAAPAVALVDATQVFAEIRRGADAAERRLLARADEIAAAALDQVDAAAAGNAGVLTGAVERHARLAGAEEVYIVVAPDLAADRRMVRGTPALAIKDRFALTASIAYKGSWVRRARTFAADGAAKDALARADQWFARLVGAIKPDWPLAAQITAHVQALSGATLTGWMAESCLGSYPLQTVAGSHGTSDWRPRLNDSLVLTAELTIGDMPWMGAAPLIVGPPSSP